MGRVCYHPCETKCNRAEIDEAVGINSVERFLGDLAIENGWAFDKPVALSGKRVLVVGAGPAGLSAAYHLRRLGHDVTIREAGPLAGGMMRFGIPKYRLPRPVLDAEVKRITDLGVRLELNAKVDDIETTMREGGYDAAFLAVGAHIARRAYIPAGGAAKILDAVTLLRSMEGEAPPLLGRKVVIYGGGNTALDAARTARRLGADEAIIVYRRTREKMPAHDFELEEALQEGVSMKWLSTIKAVDGGAMTIEKMKLDDKGFPQPTGEFETLEADSLVLALGQDVDLSLLNNAPGIVNRERRRQGRARHDDRAQGRLRRRRHGALGAHRHRRRRPRQEGRALRRRLPARRNLRAAAQARPSELRAAQRLVLRGRAGDGAADDLGGAPHREFRGDSGRPRRDQRPLRSAPLPLLRQLLRMRQLLRRMPRQRGDQARRRANGSSSTTIIARAAGCAPRNARVARSIWRRRRFRRGRNRRRLPGVSVAAPCSSRQRGVSDHIHRPSERRERDHIGQEVDPILLRQPTRRRRRLL